MDDEVSYEQSENAHGDRKHPAKLLQQAVHQPDLNDTVDQEIDDGEVHRRCRQRMSVPDDRADEEIALIERGLMLGDDSEGPVHAFRTEDQKQQTAQDLQSAVDAFDGHGDLKQPVLKTTTRVRQSPLPPFVPSSHHPIIPSLKIRALPPTVFAPYFWE